MFMLQFGGTGAAAVLSGVKAEVRMCFSCATAEAVTLNVACF